MRKTFDLVTDPQGGWLKVPVNELERLGIATAISETSLFLDGVVYLDQHTDLPLFNSAREARAEPFTVKTHARTKTSRIRNYQPFKYVSPLMADLEHRVQTAKITESTLDSQDELTSTVPQTA